MVPIIEINTERLRLRQWRDDDREPFAALCADPRVMEYLLPVPNRDASDAIVERCRALIASQGWGFWAVELRNTGAFIGIVGIQVPRITFPFSPCTEIGWRIASSHWHQGYATEAARAALAVGFEQLKLAEIVAFTALNNQRSRSIMEKLGMKQAPHTFGHPAVPVAHPLHEHCLYRLSRAQWAEQTGAFLV